LASFSCTNPQTTCIGCVEQYPFYTEQHLVSKASSIPTDAEISAQYASLKKVFVFPVSSRRQTVVGFANEFLSALEKRGWKILDSDTQVHTSNPLSDIEKATGIQEPDIVAFYMTEYSEKSHYFYRRWSELPEASFLKVSILEDFNFDFQIRNADFFSKNADVLLVRYPEAFNQVVPNCEKPIYHFPHSAGENYFNNAFKENKLPKVLLSGMISKEWYPLRHRAQELINNNQNFITHRKHPGYQPGIDPVKEAISYAQEIARHQLALTGAGISRFLPAPYILAKHFEIPAAGSVMITDKFVAPLMERLGFIENVHYLTTTPDTLETDLQQWLTPENMENLESIAIAGQKLVAEQHTMEKRVKQFELAVWLTWKNRRGNE
jgi:hypothetical protein